MSAVAYNELYLDDAMENIGDTVEYMVCDGGLKLSTVLDMYIHHETDVSKFVESANEIIKRNRKNVK